MVTRDDKQTEVDANYEVFLARLPALMDTHAGKFVVMRRREPIEFFDTARDALLFATRTFPDGLFSIQEVTQRVIDLGWFSNAAAHVAVRS